MKILLKDARILDPGSPFHKKRKNILIKNGIIASIGTKAYQADRIIESKNLCVSPGWFDMRANFNDPGYEHKEDLHSGSEAAAAGGFTGAALLPNTMPPVHTKNEVTYIKEGNANRITRLYPVAAITKDIEGEELTEMLDLHAAGAIAFSDGDKPVWHTDILLKSLQYLQKIDGLLISKPEDIHLNHFGTMHEGVASTMLGMKGMPSIAEEVIVQRDLKLLEYAGGRIHFSAISTEKSVDLIRKAKRRGLNVTCDVPIANLLFDDSSVGDFDTNFKVNPPFRSKGDIKALIKGIQDNTIDVIVSAHSPQDSESKNLEFGLADFGIIGLQTFLPGLVKLSETIALEEMLPKITTAPRSILGLDPLMIEVKMPAELTVFDPGVSWQFDESTNKSKSVNSPFWNQTLTGKVLASINNNQIYIAQ